MQRRDFISSTAAATAAALTAPRALRAAAAPARIPLGFLGATYSHGAPKIELAMKSPDWDFVGVCDPTPAGREICVKLGATMISQEELFARAKVVAVESEIRDHAAHALLALRAGKHVHLEKPCAATLADARAVIALAREKNSSCRAASCGATTPVSAPSSRRCGRAGSVTFTSCAVSSATASRRAPRRVG